MKKIIFLLLISLKGFSQSNVDLRGDSIRIYKDGGSAELVLRNKTKDTLGFLENMGNGITEFHTISGSGGGGSANLDGSIGRILYLAASGKGYTVPIINDSANNLFKIPTRSLYFDVLNGATTSQTEVLQFNHRNNDTSQVSIAYYPFVFNARPGSGLFGNFSIKSASYRLAGQTGPDDALFIGYGLEQNDSSRSSALVFESNYRQGGNPDSSRQFETYFEQFVNDGHGTATNYRPWFHAGSRKYKSGFFLFHADSYSFYRAQDDSVRLSIDNNSIHNYIYAPTGTFDFLNAQTNQGISFALLGTGSGSQITASNRLNLIATNLQLAGTIEIPSLHNTGIPYITTGSGTPVITDDPTDFNWDFSNHLFNISNNSALRITSTGTIVGTWPVKIDGSGGGNWGVYVKNADASSIEQFFMENDRGSLLSNGGLALGNTNTTYLDGIFGFTHGRDMLFLLHGGANGLGMAIGTTNNTDLILGTNNINRGGISAAGNFTITNITTGDPGSGAGLWLLGKKLNATVAFDTAHYVEVKIDGTLYKLALAN